MDQRGWMMQWPHQAPYARRQWKCSFSELAGRRLMASRCSNAMEKRQDTRLVNNYNDITHHFLYYIYVHSDLAKAKKSAS